MTDTTPEAVAGMVEALQLHAHDDCGGQDIPTHIGNLAAAMLTALSAEVEQLKADREAAIQMGRHLIASAEAERDQARADLAEAVGLLEELAGDEECKKGCGCLICKSAAFLAKHTSPARPDEAERVRVAEETLRVTMMATQPRPT